MDSAHRFFGNFLSLQKLVGFRSAVAFTVRYAWSRWVLPRRREFHISLRGIHFHAPSIEQFSELFTGIFFSEYYYLSSSDRPIAAIDCGANIGISLVYIKMRCPNARVICFEPNPAARVFLERTITSNGWKSEVTVEPYGLGRTEGTVDFFIDRAQDTSSGGSTTHFLRGYAQPTNVLSVPIKKLSAYLGKPVDFLKIDIEGAEFDVLDDLISSGALSCVATLQMEHHYYPGFLEKPLSHLLALLESAGFTTAVQATLRPRVLIGRTTMTAYMVYAWRV